MLSLPLGKLGFRNLKHRDGAREMMRMSGEYVRAKKLRKQSKDKIERLQYVDKYQGMNPYEQQSTKDKISSLKKAIKEKNSDVKDFKEDLRREANLPDPDNPANTIEHTVESVDMPDYERMVEVSRREIEDYHLDFEKVVVGNNDVTYVDVKELENSLSILNDQLRISNNYIETDSKIKEHALDYMLADQEISDVVYDMTQKEGAKGTYKTLLEDRRATATIKKLNKEIAQLKKDGVELFTDPEMLAEIESLAASTPRNEEFHNDITLRLDNIKSILVNAGIITQEQADGFNNEFYAGTHRDILDGIDDFNINDPHAKAGDGTSDIDLKKSKKGGDGRMVDQMKQLMKLEAYAVTKGLENQRLRVSAELMIKHDMAKEVGPNAKGPNIITFKDKGKDKRVEILDREMYIAMQPMSPSYIKGRLGGILNATKRLLTEGVTNNPAFQAANFLKDTVGAAILRPGFIPVWSSFKGIHKILTKHPHYIAMRNNGFTMDRMMNFGSAEDQQKYYEIVAKDKRTFNPFNPLEYTRALGSLMEGAARAEVFSIEYKKDGDLQRAGAIAKSVGADFTDRGSSNAVHLMVQLFPFQGARLNSMKSMVENIRENPKSFLMKGSMMSVASGMLWALNQTENKEEWDDLEQDEKQLYWHFWVRDQKAGGDSKKSHFRIPKPFDVGLFFGSSAESMLDSSVGKGDMVKSLTFLTEEMFGSKISSQYVLKFLRRHPSQPTHGYI